MLVVILLIYYQAYNNIIRVGRRIVMLGTMWDLEIRMIIPFDAIVNYQLKKNRP